MATAATAATAAAVVGRPPSLGGAARAAAGDLYYHSWRLVPANLVWSAIAIAVLVAFAVSSLGLILAPILALPTAGLFRMAAGITRGEAVSFSDSIRAWRTDTAAELALGSALVLGGLVLAINFATGLALGTVLGWALATLAFWGLLATWLLAWSAWPLLVDPRRAGWPIRARLQLAGLLLLAHPVRLAALGLGLGVFLAASAVAIVALLTVSVAVAALVASRYVLPAADLLDERLGFSRARGLLSSADLAES